MGAVTYPDEKVAAFINARTVPVQMAYDAKPYADDFNIQWTPAVILLDEDGKEHFRTTGFLPPEEFIPSLLLGMLKVHFDLKQFREAIDVGDTLTKEYPKSKVVPETIFWQGVANYEDTHDPSHLKAAYKKLKAEHPSSEWAIRAEPYDLLR
ncbi:MAG: hypothetical protein PHT96_02735 [Syntrophorhabdaceae bacterium]|nr:thioredoxin family protein [Syntrophorhabdaceae bacterium]MDD4195313.1 hypothetical protein [Syntrophorhabdaceae bacterium]